MCVGKICYSNRLKTILNKLAGHIEPWCSCKTWELNSTVSVHPLKLPKIKQKTRQNNKQIPTNTFKCASCQFDMTILLCSTSVIYCTDPDMQLGAAGMKSAQENARKPCSGAQLELSPAKMAANEWNMLAYLAPCKSCHLSVYPWERKREWDG